MRADRTELRAGLAETRRYLLSHHEPGDWDRCYQPVVFGRRVRLCARCSGIYPGILAGALASLASADALGSVFLVAVLPLPALLDWAVTAFTDHRGFNPVRTLTGGLLGFGYALGAALLLGAGDLRVAAVGAAYALAAGGLLALEGSSGPGP